MTKISPNYTSETFGEHPTLDQKILIFEDREIGWRFRIVRETEEKVPDSGYGLISMLFSYFEMLAQYRSGTSSKSDSKNAFSYGVRNVYPTSTLQDADLNDIYDRVRCGMYHNGYTKRGTLLSGDFAEALGVECGNVLIDPHKLLKDLQSNLTCYIASLKDANNAILRRNFERIFDAGTQ